MTQKEINAVIRTEGTKFASDKHKKDFISLLAQMRIKDRYHLPVAYLFTLDSECRAHITDLFDIDHDIIIIDGLEKGWQTSTSLQITRLAFNLWNNYADDYKRSTPSEIFCCRYAPYFWEAIKIRYPEYCEADE